MNYGIGTMIKKLSLCALSVIAALPISMSAYAADGDMQLQQVLMLSLWMNNETFTSLAYLWHALGAVFAFHSKSLSYDVDRLKPTATLSAGAAPNVDCR